MLPAISIVTPSYNQAAYLEECIESVLGQGYPNLEYIIMDGGSNDGSVEIIKKYEKHLAYWQSRPDGGQYRAVSEGFRRASGEIMAWLNSDDKYHPLAFAKGAYVFAKHPEVRWITGRMAYWDADGNLDHIATNLPVFSRLKHLEGHFDKPYIQQESTFWRRSLWKEAGGMLTDSLSLAGDLELWTRFFRHDRLHTVDTLLGGYRFHGAQRGIEHAGAYLREALQLMESERCAYRQAEAVHNTPPVPMGISREQLAEFMIENGIKPESPSMCFCWRHYTENLIGITNSQVRKKDLALSGSLQNEVSLFGLVKPSAISLMSDRLEELEELQQRVLQLNDAGERRMAEGDYRGALETFQDAFQLSDSYPRTMANLIRALWQCNEPGRAFEIMARALSEHAHNRIVVLASADVLMRAGAGEQALVGVCDEYLSTNPHDEEVKQVRSAIGAQS